MTYSEFHFFWNPKRNGGHRPEELLQETRRLSSPSPDQDLERHSRLAPAPLWPCPGDGPKIMVIDGIFMGFSWTKNDVGFDVMVLICSNGKKHQEFVGIYNWK